MKRIVLFLIGLGFWLLLTWNLHWQNLIVGSSTAFIMALLFGGMAIKEPFKVFHLNRWFWFLCYIPFFLWECVKANFDVAYRVLHPEMPIKPGIVKVRTTLKTDIAKTFLANSVTFTPGTMTVDIKDDYLYIHWIYVKTTENEEAARIIIRRFEFLLAKIFD